MTRESTKWPYAAGIRATGSALAIHILEIMRTMRVRASKIENYGHELSVVSEISTVDVLH
jgi:hypothetical protein